MAKSQTGKLHMRVGELEALLAAERETHRAAMQVAENKLALCRAAHRGKDAQIVVLEKIAESERIQRVAAQRGLVRYMKMHDLEERIGYDPDSDPSINEPITVAPIHVPGD